MRALPNNHQIVLSGVPDEYLGQRCMALLDDSDDRCEEEVFIGIMQGLANENTPREITPVCSQHFLVYSAALVERIEGLDEDEDD